MTIIHGVLGGKIYTFKEPHHTAEALLINNGIIVKQTTNVKAFIESPPHANLLHVQGNIVLPGFIDSHLHVLSLGKKLDQLNLQNTRSIKDLQHALKEYAETHSNKTWILGYGWDQGVFKEQRYPTKEDLDAVVPDRPVFLWRACHHIAVVNSKALDLSHITTETIPPDGGIIDKNEQGQVTGILRENAMDLVKKVIPPLTEAEKKAFIIKALTYLRTVGITSVQTNDPKTFRIYKELEREEKLPLRVYLTPSIDELPLFTKQGLKTGDGSSMLRLGRFKLFADGSLGAETAALQSFYNNSTNKGILLYDDTELSSLLTSLKQAHCQPETHAIGDAAAKQIVHLYAKIFTKEDRPVLTHCQVLDKDIIATMSHHGIIANIQPIFINTDMRWAREKLGEKRMMYSYAWKTLLNNGVSVAGGSDAPIEPPNPLFGIYAAVTRKNLHGEPSQGWYAHEKLSAWEAFQLFTTNAAYAEFQEHKKGKLAPGYYADFIVIDKDPFTCPPEDIKDIQVLATIVHGKIVYNALHS